MRVSWKRGIKYRYSIYLLFASCPYRRIYVVVYDEFQVKMISN